MSFDDIHSTTADWVRYSRTIEQNPNLSRTAKIAILSSFNTAYLSDYLRVLAHEHGITLSIHTEPYGGYIHKIWSEESDFFQQEYDLVFVAIRPESIDGNWNKHSLFDDPTSMVSNVVGSLRLLVTKIREKAKCPVVLFNFHNDRYSPLGINDRDVTGGLRMRYDLLNAQLFSSLQEQDVRILDYDNLFVISGSNRNARMYFLADLDFPEGVYPFLTREMMSFVVAHKGWAKKCLVLDLDNTIWGGILGEDGFDGIHVGGLFPGNAFLEFQRQLLGFYERGVILAVCSRNSLDDVMQAIRHHPRMILREQHFACIMANWNDKPTNIAEIARALNISKDSFVFVDDNPNELLAIKMAHPEVETVRFPSDPALFMDCVHQFTWMFSILRITDEDKLRGQRYVKMRHRTEFSSIFDNLEEYYRRLEIKLRFTTCSESSIGRLSQLSQRTNQFNLSNSKYSIDDIRKMWESREKYVVGGIEVEDRFGDHGLVGMFVLRKLEQSAWNIDSLMLSCRVLGMGIEKSILGYIIDIARKCSAAAIYASVVRTDKNYAFQEFYQKNGFSVVDDREVSVIYHRSIVPQEQNQSDPWVEIIH